jgi:hypothetical protein
MGEFTSKRHTMAGAAPSGMALSALIRSVPRIRSDEKRRPEGRQNFHEIFAA